MSFGRDVHEGVREISSPCFTLTGVTFVDDPARGPCAQAVVAPAWVRAGEVHPALLQVVLDSGLGMLAMTAMAPDEVSISGSMHTLFGAGVAKAGTRLDCSGRILSHRGGLLVVYGDVTDEGGAVLVHGTALYHTLVRPLANFEALPDESVFGTDLDDIISLVVSEESPGRIVSLWNADPRLANRHGRVHGGFVSALSEQVSRQLAARSGEILPLDHTHHYLRPVPTERGRVIRCEASLDRLTRRVITISCRLLDEDGIVLGVSASSYSIGS